MHNTHLQLARPATLEGTEGLDRQRAQTQISAIMIDTMVGHRKMGSTGPLYFCLKAEIFLFAPVDTTRICFSATIQ